MKLHLIILAKTENVQVINKNYIYSALLLSSALTMHELVQHTLQYINLYNTNTLFLPS